MSISWVPSGFTILCLVTSCLKTACSWRYCEIRSLTGLIRIRQHLYLSFLRNSSPYSLANGWTGPAPISRIVTLYFLMSSLSKKVSRPLAYVLNFYSPQSRSFLIFILGRTLSPLVVLNWDSRSSFLEACAKTFQLEFEYERRFYGETIWLSHSY